VIRRADFRGKIYWIVSLPLFFNQSTGLKGTVMKFIVNLTDGDRVSDMPADELRLENKGGGM
jgi:hypothetical protein